MFLLVGNIVGALLALGLFIADGDLLPGCCSTGKSIFTHRHESPV